MVIDASAIVALLSREPEAEELKDCLDAARNRLVSPLAVNEAAVSFARSRLGPNPKRKSTPDEIRAAFALVSEFIEINGVKEIPITPDMAALAIEAAAVFGKAVGHPADLNFGDCFAYACAKAHRAPLLFKGDDFPLTDIKQAASHPTRPR